MDDAERLAWLGLCWGAEIGPAGFARVLEACGSASAALEADPDELVHGEAKLRPAQAEALREVRQSLERYEELAAQARAAGAAVYYNTDADYPAALRELPHPPPVVCVRGQLRPADRAAIGIVGTRSPTYEGAEMAGRLAAAAAAEEFTVVSGLARGVDTASHHGALAHEGRTIAVIGSGINNVTPPENEELAERVAAAGALISELSPIAEPTIPNLMARNRLISIFSRGVIVVESGATGGSLATAQAAMHQGRKLYAVQWPDQHERREGNARLLSMGAEAVLAPADMRWVCMELRAWEHHAPEEPAPKEDPQLSLF